MSNGEIYTKSASLVGDLIEKINEQGLLPTEFEHYWVRTASLSLLDKAMFPSLIECIYDACMMDLFSNRNVDNWYDRAVEILEECDWPTGLIADIKMVL